MHRTAQVAIASLVLAALVLLTPAIASADQQRFTLEVSPVFFQDNTGDSSVPPLGPNYTPLYCTAGQPTCPNGNPQTTSNLRLDYGLTYQINKRWSINYSHSNFDFSLGRISSIPTGSPVAPQYFSVLMGSIQDRIDQGTLTYQAGHGLTLDGYYTSHQRISIAAIPIYSTCYLNQEQCIGNTSNPSSINAVYWGVGAAYTFGPHTPYEPPMFKATFDINYYPRPANGNCTDPATAQAACNSNGIPGYVGSGATYPWSLTWFPFSVGHLLQPGTIPFVGYSDSPIWFHGENSPEAFNNVVAGLVQILPHGLSLSYTYLKLNGRYSSDTVPYPDSIRSATSILKLTYDLHF